MVTGASGQPRYCRHLRKCCQWFVLFQEDFTATYGTANLNRFIFAVRSCSSQFIRKTNQIKCWRRSSAETTGCDQRQAAAETCTWLNGSCRFSISYSFRQLFAYMEVPKGNIRRNLLKQVHISAAGSKWLVATRKCRRNNRLSIWNFRTKINLSTRQFVKLWKACDSCVK